MGNIFQMSWLIPVLPLLGFLILGLGRNAFSRSVTTIIGCGSVLISFIISALLFNEIVGGSIAGNNIHFFDFLNISTLYIGFDFKIDQLSGLFLLIITGIGFLIHVYSSAYMKEEPSKDFARYFSYLNLFIFSMLLLVMGSNFIVMFIGWEGVGLCSYLLIGYWFKNAAYNKAAQKAFIMNRIGDLGFLLAIFWMIAKLGTVSYDEVLSAENLARLTATDITGITLLLLVGATGKSAQIPLFTWLPDAMAGPTPVSALIHAATMVTAGIYMIARANVLFSMAPITMNIITVVGLATSFVAATIALRQHDIKKVLAYSTVSQLGLMFLALGTGAYTAAIFHVMTHAFFKALLFLGSGSVIHAMSGEQDLRNMGGLKKSMPITHFTFLVGCLAIAGIPPLSGFFSKDEILAAVFSKNSVLYYFSLIIPFLTAFYMFRLYAMTFLGAFRGTDEQRHHLHESPLAMTLPLIILAILSFVGGWVGIPDVLMHGGHKLAAFLEPVFQKSNLMAKSHEISHATEYTLMILSVLIAVAAIVIAIRRFAYYSKNSEEAKSIGKFLENKWYIDELYESIISNPLKYVAAFMNNMIEKKIIDGVVNGTGKLVNFGSRQLRWLQSGQVGSYVLFMTLGLLLLLIIKLFM